MDLQLQNFHLHKSLKDLILGKQLILFPLSRVTKLTVSLGISHLNVAKCNLAKVNLELMLPAVSPSLHRIRGGAPLEFARANYVQPCLLAIVAITASVSESLRIH